MRRAISSWPIREGAKHLYDETAVPEAAARLDASMFVEPADQSLFQVDDPGSRARRAGLSGHGSPVFDRFENPGGRCLILSNEDSAGVLKDRLAGFVNGHGWDPVRVSANLMVRALKGDSLDDPAFVQHLVPFVREGGFQLVAIDPLREWTDAEESSSTETRPVVRALRALTEVTTPILIHHSGYG